MNQISSRFAQEYKANISKDLLNKLSFSASTNDMFIRYKRIEYNGHSYTLERGAAFEAHLEQNLNNFLEHPLGYYQSFEQKGKIPLMIFSPTVINDGRRLWVSSQNLSYIVSKRDGNSAYENIDYQTFFKGNDPNSIRFSSVLRASATFPLVMPLFDDTIKVLLLELIAKELPKLASAIAPSYVSSLSYPHPVNEKLSFPLGIPSAAALIVKLVPLLDTSNTVCPLVNPSPLIVMPPYNLPLT